jgi:hypothetical protein
MTFANRNVINTYPEVIDTMYLVDVHVINIIIRNETKPNRG